MNKVIVLVALLTSLVMAPYMANAQPLSWNFSDILTETDQGGSMPDMVIQDNGTIHLSFWHPNRDLVAYARRDPGLPWTIEFIDPTGINGWNNAIALDDAGDPHVVYWQNEHGHSQLRHAVRLGTGNWQVDELPGDSVLGWGEYGPSALTINNERIKPSLDIIFDTAGAPRIFFFDHYMESDAFPLCDSSLSNYGFKLNTAYKSGGNWKTWTFEKIADKFNSCSGMGLPYGDRFGEYCSAFIDASGRVGVTALSRFNNEVLWFENVSGDTTWTYHVLDSLVRTEPGMTWSQPWYTFEGLSNYAAPNGDVLLSYTSSFFYGENWLSNTDTYLDHFLVRFTDTTRYYYHLNWGEYRNHTGMAGKGSDTLFVVTTDLDEQLLLLMQTCDGGIHWNQDTLGTSVVTTAASRIAIDGDSIRVLYYNSLSESLTMASRAIGNDGCGAGANVFFSEYIEGTGNNRALEIVSTSRAPYDLSHEYIIYRFDNGSPTATDSVVPLIVSRPDRPGVICHPSASGNIKLLSEQTSAFMTYTGNDALVLKNKITGDTMDIIGEIGVNPGGSGWAVNGGTTLDNTLTRDPMRTAGELDWSVASGQWTAQGVNVESDVQLYQGFATVAASSEPIFETEVTVAQHYGSSMDALVDENGGSAVAHLVTNEIIAGGLFYYTATEAGSWTWTGIRIDSSVAAARAISLGQDASGDLWAAYYANPGNDLRLGRMSSGNWSYETLDSAGAPGHTSVNISPADTVYVAWHNETTGCLMLAHRHRSGGTWLKDTVDCIAPPTGQYVRILSDASNLHLAYHDPTCKGMIYARRAVSGGSWSRDTVLSSNFSPVGKFCSMDLDSGNEPSLLFLDEQNNKLYFAERTGPGIWDMLVVDSTSSFSLGRPSDLVVDRFDNPWTAFNNFSNYDRVNLRHRDINGWAAVGVGNQGRIANSFSFEIANDDLFLIGRKNEPGNTGLGMLYAPQGIFVENEEPLIPEATKITVAPNPSTGEGTFVLELAEPGNYRLDVYDLQGRHVASPLRDRWLESGKQEVPCRLQAAGMYIYRLSSGEQQWTGKWIIRP